MPRRPKFKERKTPDGWVVNVPRSCTESGKREQRFFKTRDAAKDHGATLRELLLEKGTQAASIRPTLAEAATAAEEILRPWGLGLVEAARMAAAIRERENASKTLARAGAQWLAECEALRPRTVANYRRTVERMGETLGERLLASLTAEELQASLAPPGTVGASAAERIRNAKAFWRWAATKGWCEAATFNAVSIPKAARDAAEIETLTPAEAEAILRVAEAEFPQSVPLFAVQLFAGIRAEEVTRLRAEHVSPEGIDLPASVTKRGRRRHITPNATLAAWLKKYPFKPCPNWRETSCAVRRLAGWEVVSRVLNDRIAAGTLDALPDAKRGPWPQNALRHSHASYAVASGVPLESLLFTFGHAGNANMLRQHYVGRSSMKTALEFFAIMPAGMPAPATLKPVEPAVA